MSALNSILTKSLPEQQEIFSKTNNAIENSVQIITQLGNIAKTFRIIAQNELPIYTEIFNQIKVKMGCDSGDISLGKTIDRAFTLIRKNQHETYEAETRKIIDLVEHLPRIDLTTLPLTFEIETGGREALIAYNTETFLSANKEHLRGLQYEGKNVEDLKIFEAELYLNEYSEFLKEYADHANLTAESLKNFTSATEPDYIEIVKNQMLLEHIINFKNSANEDSLKKIILATKNDPEKLQLVLINIIENAGENITDALKIVAQTYDTSGGLVEFLTLNPKILKTNLGKDLQEEYLTIAIRTLINGPSLENLSREELIQLYLNERKHPAYKDIYEALIETYEDDESGILIKVLKEISTNQFCKENENAKILVELLTNPKNPLVPNQADEDFDDYFEKSSDREEDNQPGDNPIINLQQN